MHENFFSSALLKLCWLGPNASGWNLGFIRCCLRKNTYASSRKHGKQKQGLGLLCGDRLLQVSWKRNDVKLQKKSPSVLFSIWCHYGDRVCAYFLDYWPVPSVSSLWENACLQMSSGSHLITLIPLLGSALLAFFLKMPLDPQSHIGTLSKHNGNGVYFRKSSFLACVRTQRLTVLCRVTAIDILFLTLIFFFSQTASPICSVSVVYVFLHRFSNYFGNKAEHKQGDK